MNKTAIKNYAIWARTKLIEDIKYKAGLLGISEKEIAAPLAQSTNEVQYFAIGTRNPYAISGVQIAQRASLANAIKRKAQEVDYKTAYNQIVEEVAYTWFNRFIAVRFMEVNEYLPCKIRVLSAVDGRQEPDIVQNPFDAKLDYTPSEENLINEYQLNNEGDKLFNLLFIKVCNDLSKVLPQLFEAEDDYTELLLNISYTDRDGLIYKLVHDIPEEDFNIEMGGQVEIIGWLYQYYNTELKKQIENKISQGFKVSKDEIAPKTQLFTPDWIVRYMVENSLGRMWVEGHPSDFLKSQWKYYLEEAEQKESVKAELSKIREQYAQLQPEDIKVIDPCMGSGHILVYAFEVLMQIYTQMGYAEKEAAISILENNLYGLDIDERAFQLAYFAVVMKARQYHKFILKKQVQCHIHPIVESNGLKVEQLQYFGAQLDEFSKNSAMQEMHGLIIDMHDAKEYGSLINVGKYNWELLQRLVDDFDSSFQMDLFATFGIEKTQQKLKELVAVGKIIGDKYEVLITNPPYMGNGTLKLAEFLQTNYSKYKYDTYAAFMKRSNEFIIKNGFVGLVTGESWMFLPSFAKLRDIFISNTRLISMYHLGLGAFDEGFGTTAFIISNMYLKEYSSVFLRAATKKDIIHKIETLKNKTSSFYYHVNIERFKVIDEYPFVYWMKNAVLEKFNKSPLSSVAITKSGIVTGNNDFFMKLWFEISLKDFVVTSKNGDIIFPKWVPAHKGGGNNRFYGNFDYVLRLKDLWDPTYYKDNMRRGNTDFYFKEGLTWSTLSNKLAFRYSPEGFVYETKGSMCFLRKEDIELFYLLGLLNSCLCKYIINILSPTLDYNRSSLSKMPFIYDEKKANIVNVLVKSNVDCSKNDWDAFEISWDFQKHPLVPTAKEWEEQRNYQFSVVRIAKFGLLEWHYKQLVYYTNRRFKDLKDNEEELNSIFIDIYGLQGELTPEVEEKDVTVHRIFDNKEDVPESMKGSNYVLTKQDVVKSLLSYAVGCMFGRYSLDVEGLAYAGGEWDDSKYARFIPDPDNVIPITDEDYFEDDIVGRFVEWLKVVYGKETLEENLRFVADALGGSGDTPRQRIRNYFLKDFFKDHCKTYQKRPIYWLYDSGKQNGFKALIYMHRYNKDTTGQVRAEYLGRMEGTYESEINRMEDIKNNGKGREVALAAKRIEKLKKQLKECRDYDEYIGHLALAAIDIDLDDGVKVNYVKVQTAKDGKVLPLLAKI